MWIPVHIFDIRRWYSQDSELLSWDNNEWMESGSDFNPGNLNISDNAIDPNCKFDMVLVAITVHNKIETGTVQKRRKERTDKIFKLVFPILEYSLRNIHRKYYYLFWKKKSFLYHWNRHQMCIYFVQQPDKLAEN